MTPPHARTPGAQYWRLLTPAREAEVKVVDHTPEGAAEPRWMARTHGTGPFYGKTPRAAVWALGTFMAEQGVEVTETLAPGVPSAAEREAAVRGAAMRAVMEQREQAMLEIHTRMREFVGEQFAQLAGRVERGPEKEEE